MTKNKEKLVKVEAVCTSMTGEFGTRTKTIFI